MVGSIDVDGVAAYDGLVGAEIAILRRVHDDLRHSIKFL